MRRNPERFAWTVLLISLFLCVALAIAVPLGIRSFINDTTEVALITLEVQQGTALVSLPGSDNPIGVTTQKGNLPENSTVGMDASGQAVLTVRAPRDGSTLLNVQIYGSTNLEIVQAGAPRFRQSNQPYQLTLHVESGRVRVTVAGSLDRPIDARVITPQSTTDLQEGSYAFDISNEVMQVTVREGEADVSAKGSTLPLSQGQRTLVRLGSRPDGILSPESNLITNGDFRRALADTWDVSNDLQVPTEPPGTVTIVVSGGRRAAQFDRAGFSHAQTEMRQVISKNVRDFRSLKLHFVVQIISQDVPVCGQAGSECPMMMRLDYKDADGTDRSFFQGFYSLPDPNNLNPNYCTSCGTRQEFIPIAPNFSYTFDKDDLMKLLAPTQITGITFYASGHSYRAQVSEIELLGEQ